jgi:hypothetical protein
MLWTLFFKTQYMDISRKLNGFGGADPIEIHWQQAIVTPPIFG